MNENDDKFAYSHVCTKYNTYSVQVSCTVRAGKQQTERVSGTKFNCRSGGGEKVIKSQQPDEWSIE